MRELKLSAEPFDAAYCLFDAIGYVQTDDAIGQVLDGVRRNLRPESLFVFEFWHAPAMLAQYEPVRVRRWALPKGELLRISTTRLLEGRDLAEVRYDLYELHDDRSYESLSETQVNRFFTVSQMEALLAAANFEALDWRNGYTWEQAIDDDTWHVLAIARPA